MFFLVNLIKELSLSPEELNIDIKKLISGKIKELEGKVIGDYGYIVVIVEFQNSGKGFIENESGNVNFKINYKAITYKPLKDELLYAIPFFINEHGFFCNVGPLKIFVSQHMIEDEKKVCLNVPLLLQIIAVRINSNEITALAKIFDE